MIRAVLVGVWAGLMLLPGMGFAQDSDVLIEMFQKVREKVSIALPEFVLNGEGQDFNGYGASGQKILENDLRLSELFEMVHPSVYKGQLDAERVLGQVNFAAWHDLGTQWLVKTDYEVDPGGDSFLMTFRVYDAVNERFLMGKRYRGTEKLLRRVIHRFADELVLELTGKRGVAETRLAFLSWKEGHKEIFSIDFDGENARQLTHDNSVNLTPAWSPDGRKIAFTSYADHNPDLVMIDSLGKSFRKTLLRLPGLNTAPSWSSDLRRIALVLSKDQNSEIYVLHSNRRLQRLTRHFNIDVSPSWSPDGTRIAFTSDRSGTGSPQIYIMDAKEGDRNGVRRISFGSSYNDNPAWSPSGDMIAFTSRVGKKFQIKIYDLNSKKLINFTSGSENSEEPTWSPDSRFIAYKRSDNRQSRIMIKRLGSDKPRQLSFMSGGGFSPAWSPFFKR